MSKHSSTRSALAVFATTAAVLLSLAAPTWANIALNSADMSLQNADGTFSRQAGAHADFTTSVSFPSTTPSGAANPVPTESVRDVDVDLPPGLVGNPTSTPLCSLGDLNNAGGGVPACRPESQVGVVTIHVLTNAPTDLVVGLYNLEHGSDVPALFGFNYQGVIATITPRVRPGDYGISAGSLSISQSIPIYGVRVTLWGVPADPVHDPDRFIFGSPGATSSAALAPFLSNPTSCDSSPASFTVRADSWENPGAFATQSLTDDGDGAAFRFDGCERLHFNPSITVQPLSHVADAPTGLDVDVTVPQDDAPNGLATPHVRRTVVALPQGMSVSPSSAAGLGACATSQIALGTNDAPTCPESSRIGSVEIDTPLLEDPLKGDVILAAQNDNPFHSLLALYLVARGPGFWLKLPGRVDLDQATGQLTTTFDNTPQLPFTRLHVQFRGGSRASLATPPSCGTYRSFAQITSWASDQGVDLSTPMTIDEGCDSPKFAPSLSAGTTNPFAGQDSPFSLTLTRADRTPYLSRIDAVLPPGLLARIASVTQCDAGAAAAGTCPQSSLIGHTSVLSGPGSDPLALTGNVYLTGPYRGAPFGLSIAVPSAGQAGPFDLGIVVVRAALSVDRTDAHATVTSDPLPTIVQGFPLRLRQVNVTIDRSGFMFNPTSCAPATVFTSLSALNGATSTPSAAFRVGGCDSLPMDQRLALSFTGAKSTTDHTHPGVKATLTTSGGGANLKKVTVKLPLSYALDPDNAEALCKPEQRQALACPKASIIGTARAVSILPHPLTGPVYFVEGTRKSPSGRVIRTLPKLWIPLSADGVTIDVNASSDVDSIKRLVTTFDNLPDAPIKQFDLSINGGKHGVITVSGASACKRSKTVDSQLVGQNAKVLELHNDARVAGCKPVVTRSRATSKSVSLRVAGLGAGRLTLSGSGLKSTHRTLKGASEASITAQLTSKIRAAIRRHGSAKVRATVRFQPKGGRAVSVRKTITARR